VLQFLTGRDIKCILYQNSWFKNQRWSVLLLVYYHLLSNFGF